MGPKSCIREMWSPQADGILMRWGGCAFKAHVPEINELTKDGRICSPHTEWFRQAVCL